jgi:Ras-related GTP-binding protein C/D
MSSTGYKSYDEFGEQGDETYSSPVDLNLGYSAEDGAPAGGSSTSGGDADSKPRILLLGLRRSGKSSIQKVVFHKMSPNETLFLESTTKIVKNDIANSSFVQFQVDSFVVFTTFNFHYTLFLFCFGNFFMWSFSLVFEESARSLLC